MSFDPTVGFRVARGAKWADVLICLDCSEIIIVEPDAPLGAKGGRKARFRVAGDFDRHRAEFLSLAKEAFPNDETLK